MKITLRNKKPLIDIDSFNKKADVIFKEVVIPQIKKYKTMKAKEKAKEIFDKMFNVEDALANYPMCFDTAKQCSLIAVDEILDIDCFDMSEEHFDNHIEYWQEVKQEIEKL